MLVILTKFGIKLFGLENLYTQLCIQQAKLPSCMVSDWTLEGVLENLYEYHLKRRILCNIEWHDLFENQESDISELRELNLSFHREALQESQTSMQDVILHYTALH